VNTPDHIRTCYDTVAAEYADKFAGELAHKPLDCELLRRFASEVRGRVIDLGCGPGQTTAILHECGADVRGLDLSRELIRQAQKLHPTIPFEPGDMLALPFVGGSIGGVVAFYAIVHFTPDELRRAFAEMHRVLQPGGRVLISFHIGDGTVHVDQFLGKPVSLDFFYFQPQVVSDELVRAGFTAVEVIEREPYPNVEYPSRRAYLFASK
jgi:SAM-dependent methyltransferase